jgi:DNA repair protein RecN (Recombination protein N)
MLTDLFIKNIAIIDKLSIELDSGMTVLTVETGAGKSIIIDSINMILGARTNKSLVRYGEDKASVKAVFDTSKEIESYLCDNDIECEDGQVIISRDITSDGKSVCKINGAPVTLSVLRELAAELVNIHGQHDNQSLLTPSKHICFLDAFAGNADCLSEYTVIYKKSEAIKRELDSLNMNERERADRIDFLTYQIEEIEKARLRGGEEEELREQRDIIANAEKIVVGAETAYENIYGGEKAQSAYDGISSAAAALSDIARFDERIAAVLDRISEVMYIIEDSAHELKECSDGIEYDEQTLNEIEERLDLISRLKRKYGGDIQSILERLAAFKRELEGLEGSSERTDLLNEQLDEVNKQLGEAADKLSSSRIEAAKRLSQLVCQSLAELDMPKARFNVSVTPSGGFTAMGADVVEFMFSANTGEPEKPLVQIASGGELSRVMLAVKSILADADSVSTLIFDEIDTGVSGSAAQKIAVKMSNIAKSKQVICISHQPQIAAAANHQLLIKKNDDGQRVTTSVREVVGEEREYELARIIDGDSITQTSLEHVRQMLANAKSFK